MQDDRLDAIVKFATEEDYGLISEAELREHAPSWHAAQRLLEYLKQDFDTERILPPSTLEGTYRNGRIDEDSYVVRELTLQRAFGRRPDPAHADRGFLRPPRRHAIRRFHARETRGGQRQPHRIWRLGNSYARGQPAHVPQEGAHWQNCYYLTVAAENWHSLQAPAAALALLRHDYPIETNEGEPLEPKKLPGISEAIGNNIALFRRVA